MCVACGFLSAGGTCCWEANGKFQRRNSDRAPIGWHLLEEIEDLRHILLISFFGTSNIAPPFARVPDFHAMVEAYEDDFLILVQRHEFSQSPGNQDASRLVDFRRAGLRHDEVHEEPAL